MKAQHTPGPWRVQQFHRGIQLFGTVDFDSVKIAEIVMPYRGLEDLENHKIERSAEGMANAKLLAAAPELLEALQAVKWWVDTSRDGSNVPYPEDQVNEAIKKATE